MDLILALSILCGNYPYRSNEIIPENVKPALSYIFQLKSGELIPSSKEVNEMCMNYEINKK